MPLNMRHPLHLRSHLAMRPSPPTLVLLVALSPRAAAQVSPVPPPAPPAGPVVLLTSQALDGRGKVLRDARIGVANGKITSLSAAGGAVIDLRGYTVLPGWIDTHVHL